MSIFPQPQNGNGPEALQPTYVSSPPSSTIPLPSQTEGAASTGNERSASPKASAAPGGERAAGEPRLPSSLADLVTSFESAKQKCEYALKLLGNPLLIHPSGSDDER